MSLRLGNKRFIAFIFGLASPFWGLIYFAECQAAGEKQLFYTVWHGTKPCCTVPHHSKQRNHMIILIGSEKGGTGKTTLTTNLVTLHLAKGFDALLVDTDKQGSASAWSATRDAGDLKPVPCIQKFGKSLTTELKGLAKKYDDIFVDAGGRDSIELRAALLAADRIYIPLIPSQIDVWTLGLMKQLIEESQLFNPSLKPYFIISRASTNPAVTEVEEVQDTLRDIEGVGLCRAIIRERIAYRKAPRHGMGVTELTGTDRDGKAIIELTDFYKEIFHE
jgi:chromosome partitioning protein